LSSSRRRCCPGSGPDRARRRAMVQPATTALRSAARVLAVGFRVSIMARAGRGQNGSCGRAAQMRRTGAGSQMGWTSTCGNKCTAARPGMTATPGRPPRTLGRPCCRRLAGPRAGRTRPPGRCAGRCGTRRWPGRRLPGSPRRARSGRFHDRCASGSGPAAAPPGGCRRTGERGRIDVN